MHCFRDSDRILITLLLLWLYCGSACDDDVVARMMGKKDSRHCHCRDFGR